MIRKTFFENGNLKTIENYFNKLKNGEYIEYYINQTNKFEAVYRGGKLHGLKVTYYENGKIESKANYVKDVYHGNVKKHTLNGELDLEANYKLGKIHGLYIDYNNGVIQEKGEYKYGKRNGEWTIFDSTSNKNKTITYKSGKIITPSSK